MAILIETRTRCSLTGGFCASLNPVARPICSVIISAKNEAERIEACFDSLSQQRTKVPFEVILVDNGSSDGTFALASKLARDYRNFRVYRERQPGSASARNLGARRARGDVLLFTDADCRLAKTWIHEMSKPLLEERRSRDNKTAQHYPLAAVGGRTVSEFAKPERPNLVERYLDQLFDFWERDRLSAFPAFLPWAPTCNFAVKREVFLELGGFDGRWKNAAYDVDFCWRLVLCGFVLGYAPKAEVRHLRRSTLRGLLRQMENYAFYNQSLLATYEDLLELPKVRARQERLLGRGRRAIALARNTKNFRQATYRGLDLLSLASGVKGAISSRVFKLDANPRFHPTRQGLTPPSLEKLLPPGYAYLHREGWCYWKDAPNVGEEGDLMLYRPRRAERFRLNSTAWKIWEVKSARGQSEDAATALGQSDHDPEILRDIDELTLDLRTRRLLP
jgi:glycosyltransferase involved in cell wall biosynthesis